MLRMMRCLILSILILLSVIKSKSQSCNNEDFEFASTTSAVPNTINVSNSNGIPGWTVTSGSFTGTLNACNMSTCCPSPPTSVQLIGTNLSSGYIDPLIGPSYPIFSVMGSNSLLNANPFYQGFGNWFIKMNDTISNGEYHGLSKTIAVTPLNCLFDFAFLPIFKNSNHPNCSQPTLKLKVWKHTGCTGTFSLQTPELTINSSTITSGGTCPSFSPNLFQCPLNSSYVYLPWQKGTIDLSLYIGDCVRIELIISDCTFGDHSGYVYFDAQCRPNSYYNITCNLQPTNINVYSTCGATIIPVSLPAGYLSYLWNGPIGWPGNGATTPSVNLTLPGTYTASYLGLGMCAPLTRTITIISTPPASASLSILQNSACINSNTLTLNGQPPGGIYSGPFVSGNSFNPTSTGNFTVQYKYTDSNNCIDSTSKSITVINCPTNIINNKETIELHLSPNPVNNELKINSNISGINYSISLTNIIGEEVLNEELKDDNLKIGVSMLPNGVYFVQLKCNKEIIRTQKIIKH